MTFGDGQMAKIKTKKYVCMYHLMQGRGHDLLIVKILDGEIDDILSFSTGANREKSVSLIEKVDKVFNDYVDEFIRLHDEFCMKSRKKFIKDALYHEVFPSFMSNLRKEEDFSRIENLAQQSVKEFIRKKCRTLKVAKAFIEGA